MYALAAWPEAILVRLPDGKSTWFMGKNDEFTLPLSLKAISEPSTAIFNRLYTLKQVHTGYDNFNSPMLLSLAEHLIKKKSDLFIRTKGNPGAAQNTFTQLTDGEYGSIQGLAQYGAYIAFFNDEGDLYINQNVEEHYSINVAGRSGKGGRFPYNKVRGTTFSSKDKINHIALSDTCLFVTTEQGAVLARRMTSDTTSFVEYRASSDGWYTLLPMSPEPREIIKIQAHHDKFMLQYNDSVVYSNSENIATQLKQCKANFKVIFSELGLFRLTAFNDLFISTLTPLPWLESVPLIEGKRKIPLEKGEQVFDMIVTINFIAFLVGGVNDELSLYVTGVLPQIAYGAHPLAAIMNGAPGTFKKTVLIPGTAAARRTPSPPPAMAATAAAAASTPPRMPSPTLFASAAAAAAVDLSSWSTDHSIALWDDAVAIVKNNERTRIYLTGHALTNPLLPTYAVNFRRAWLEIDVAAYGHIRGIYAGNVPGLVFVLTENAHARQQLLAIGSANLRSYRINGNVVLMPIELHVENADPANATITSAQINLHVIALPGERINTLALCQNNLALLTNKGNIYVNEPLCQNLNSTSRLVVNTSFYTSDLVSVRINPALYGTISHLALNSKNFFIGTLRGDIIELNFDNSIPAIKRSCVPDGAHAMAPPVRIRKLLANEQSGYALLENGEIFSSQFKIRINAGSSVTMAGLTKLSREQVLPSEIMTPHLIRDQSSTSNHAVILDIYGNLILTRDLAEKFEYLAKRKFNLASPSELAASIPEGLEPGEIKPPEVGELYFCEFKLHQYQLSHVHFSYAEQESYIVVLTKTNTILIHSSSPHPELGVPYRVQKTNDPNWDEVIITADRDQQLLTTAIKKKTFVGELTPNTTCDLAVGPSGVLWIDSEQNLFAKGLRATQLCTGVQHAGTAQNLSFSGLGNHVLDIALGQNYVVAIFNDPSQNRYARITGDFATAPMNKWTTPDNGCVWHTLFDPPITRRNSGGAKGETTC